MVDNPTRPFNDRVRDKDNAAPELKPDYSRQTRINLAPAGMSGIFTAKPKAQAQQRHDRQAEARPVSILKTHAQPSLLTTGTFMSQRAYGFVVEVNQTRSWAGLDNGKITALEIQDNGKIIAQFKDRTWAVMPDDPKHLDMVQKLQDQFGDPPRPFQPIAPPTPDKDHGWER